MGLLNIPPPTPPAPPNENGAPERAAAAPKGAAGAGAGDGGCAGFAAPPNPPPAPKVVVVVPKADAGCDAPKPDAPNVAAAGWRGAEKPPCRALHQSPGPRAPGGTEGGGRRERSSCWLLCARRGRADEVVRGRAARSTRGEASVARATFCPNPKLVVEAAARAGRGRGVRGLAGGFAANEFGVVAGAPNAPPPPKLGLGCGAPNPPGAPNCEIDPARPRRTVMRRTWRG